MMPDAGAWPGTARLLARPRVRAWAAAAGAPRVWVLQAGPGSGKAATAHLLGEALGLPVFRLEPGRHAPARLATWLGLPADAAPERMADALGEWALREAAGGATFVVPWPDEPAQGGPHAEAFMRRWIAISAGIHKTIVTARVEVPWISPRLVAAGEVALLGAPELWFDPEETARFLEGVPVSPEATRATCGWPLGLASLVRLAGKPDLLTFLEDLGAAELLGALPDDLRAAALALWPVSDWRPGDVPLEDPVLGRALERLVRWGLLVPTTTHENQDAAEWLPLVRRGLGQAQGATATPEEHKAQLWRLGRWLEEREPGRSFELWLAQDEIAAAVGCITRQVATVPLSSDRDRVVGSWIDRLPPAARQGDARVLLAEGTLMLRRGSHAAATERLDRALACFRDAADVSGEFATLGRLLGVCLQREALPEARAIAVAADPLEEFGEMGDLVVYRVNRGSLEFLAGDEEAALRHYRRALDFPHLGRPRVVLAHQEACLNLAILSYERGEYGQARRALERVQRSHANIAIDPSLPLRAALQLALVHLAVGDHRQAATVLDEARSAPRPANPYHLASCRRLEGQAMMLLRRHEDADRMLRAALDLLHGQGLDGSGDAGATLVLLAELARRKGEVEAAGVLLDWAEPLAAGLPRLRASVLHCRALVAWARGEGEAATAALGAAQEVLEGVVARPLAAGIALFAAVLASERADRAAVDRHLARGVRVLREGPYYYLPLALRDIAPQVWSLLERREYRDVLEAVASRFPRAAAAVSKEAVGKEAFGKEAVGKETVGTRPGTRATAPRIEVRTFGQIAVRVGSETAGFRRRKARALLAHLLMAPSGLSRDEAAELLYPDLEWEDARHQIDNLTSFLRRTFCAGGKGTGDPGVLIKEGGRYRLDTTAIWWDARAFDQAIQAGNDAWIAGNPEVAVAHFAEALDLYADDLFAGADLAEWFEAPRQAYRSRTTQVLERSAEYYLSCGSFEAARGCAERVLGHEPAHEGAHRILMRLYARLGEAGLVRRQFDLCSRSLALHLDVAPSAETRAMLAELTGRLP